MEFPFLFSLVNTCALREPDLSAQRCRCRRPRPWRQHWRGGCRTRRRHRTQGARGGGGLERSRVLGAALLPVRRLGRALEAADLALTFGE